MTNDARLQEFESILSRPDGIRQIAEAFDRVHRQSGEERPASITVREMIDFVVEHEKVVEHEEHDWVPSP